jgi:hypothetical protein
VTVIVAVAVEGGLLVLALLFVVALLRSHAEILRRLHALENSDPSAAGPAPPPEPTLPESIPTELSGQTPAGDAVKVSLAGGGRTLLAFLSSGCPSCGPLWAGLRDGTPIPPGTRLLVLTKGPDRESPARLERLGPTRPEPLMSSAAWEAFEIPATPHFVLVDGGRVVGRGSATSWEQILGLLADADADAATLDTSARAARAEAALAAAGITDGHPSLFPSRSQ